MKTIAIACSTLKEEVMLVAHELQIDYPILWIQSGLHNTPEKLRKGLQDQIDHISNVDTILLVFGVCGNSLYGLKSAHAKIIFPQVDDCISLFLGGNRQKREWDQQGAAYYLTKGYLEMESNIWTDYQHCLAKYGEEKTRKVMSTMLKGYKSLRIIETGAYQLPEILDHTRDIAGKLSLEHEVVKGTLDILYRLFRGQWDIGFSVIEPGKPVGFSDLGLGG
ncbi:hypothetical protein DCMF_14140 [Candidatus Formimonas warabiya]|uniref:DUF1638 domain-containing protein n=1 Tax=Formimonas warabiya TaxID=1761012 RepID=A0A3G1KTJ2_FORW1|nr:hypothetical protein DCMF_14140 [Candidatus Formimonas warabiya]